MAKRRDLEVAFLAALLAAAPGCAGKPVLPWGSKSTPASPTSLDELTAKNNAANKPSWTERFAMKPKVIPAEDQTSLNTKPPKIGSEVFIQGARMHESRGNFDQAKQQYLKAIDVEPKDVAPLIGLARLHDRQQNFIEAEKVYRQAAKLEPKNAMIWNDIGLCYARQKRLADATKSLDYAVKLQPQNKMYRNNLATVLVEAGKNDDAWAQLTAVNAPAVAHYNMAYLLSQRQRTPEAVEHLQLALQADPSLTAAESLLAKLKGTAGTTEELVVEAPTAPTQPVTSYTITDAAPVEEAPVAKAAQPVVEDQYVATGPSALVNPLAPATRRSATYRMPPVEEQDDDPAPAPARLPEVEAAESATEEQAVDAADDVQLELGNPGGFYPSRRIAHDDPSVRQPNLIRLLGSDAEAAPTPDDK